MRYYRETWSEKLDRLAKWHTKFCWFPFCIPETGKRVWLETVRIRKTFNSDNYWKGRSSWEIEVYPDDQ